MISSRLINALKRKPVDTTPVWFMRQAGRYLPEYRALRQQAGGFLNMCKNPEMAAEITLQPIQRFDLDAAIIFSDILTLPDAMGLGLYFIENEGPCFEHPIRSSGDIKQLPIPDPETEMKYVLQAIQLVCQNLSVPLIGFCGSPWTVATYMVEGKSTRQFSIIKKMLYNEPDMLLALLEKLTQASCHYLEAQAAAGASALMIFDTWGGILSTPQYHLFSLSYMQTMVNFLKNSSHSRNIPIILFTKQGGQWLESLAATGCDALSLDWTVDLLQARERVGTKVALQGNLDPALLFAQPDKIAQEVKNILQTWGNATGHIFNLGHGIEKETPVEHVQAMIEAVRCYGKKET